VERRVRGSTETLKVALLVDAGTRGRRASSGADHAVPAGGAKALDWLAGEVAFSGRGAAGEGRRRSKKRAGVHRVPGWWDGGANSVQQRVWTCLDVLPTAARTVNFGSADRADAMSRCASQLPLQPVAPSRSSRWCPHCIAYCAGCAAHTTTTRQVDAHSPTHHQHHHQQHQQLHQHHLSACNSPSSPSRGLGTVPQSHTQSPVLLLVLLVVPMPCFNDSCCRARRLLPDVAERNRRRTQVAWPGPWHLETCLSSE